jgi:hypothetical protein
MNKLQRLALQTLREKITEVSVDVSELSITSNDSVEFAIRSLSAQQKLIRQRIDKCYEVLEALEESNTD